ncbi:hypothetical protein M0R88_10980 [Halorussus gelatinilyticus]|uniref:Uncharacterized protein n=1 Tax=Halorussus gelatinilyticus TaxID=2937524 RepID=A0A8U0IDB3_9EURY|nr:hypothetical protein [Halorussus gelatinilyticus]UPV99049.1 hypothetical protein M0R88_10980 [Halorussus gelatinilyticus]
MFRDDQTDDVNASRRSLLKGVAAGSVAAASAGTASASDAAGYASMAQKEQVRAQYDAEAVVRERVAEHAGEFLAALEAEGLVDSADPADLVTEPKPTGEHLERDRSVNVGAVSADEGLTAHIDLAYRTDEYDLHLIVQPEAGRAYGYLDRGETVQRLDYDSKDGVTIQERCALTEACDNQLCDDNTGNYKVYQVECCEQSGCDVGYVTGCCHQFPGYVDPCCEACGC